MRGRHGVLNATSHHHNRGVMASVVCLHERARGAHRVRGHARGGACAGAGCGARAGDRLARQAGDGGRGLRGRRQHRRDGAHGEQEADGGPQAEFCRREPDRGGGRACRRLRGAGRARRLHAVLRRRAANCHRAAAAKGQLRSEEGLYPGQRLRHRALHPWHQLLDPGQDHCRIRGLCEDAQDQLRIERRAGPLLISPARCS